MTALVESLIRERAKSRIFKPNPSALAVVFTLSVEGENENPMHFRWNWAIRAFRKLSQRERLRVARKALGQTIASPKWVNESARLVRGVYEALVVFAPKKPNGRPNPKPWVLALRRTGIGAGSYGERGFTSEREARSFAREWLNRRLQ